MVLGQAFRLLQALERICYDGLMERAIAAFAYAAASETGHVREHNEDALWIAGRFVRDERVSGMVETDSLPLFFAVADGVGGAAAGEVASEFVLRELHRRISHEEGLSAERLREICEETNALLIAAAREDAATAGMSTTCTGIAGSGDAWFWFHVGDSRLYSLTSDRFIQLSTDHTLREEMNDASIPGNIITNCFGMEDLRVDVGALAPAESVRLMLCSDGLSDYAGAEDLAQAAARSTGAERLNDSVDEAVTLALDGGGGDNVSVLLLAPRSTTDAHE